MEEQHATGSTFRIARLPQQAVEGLLTGAAWPAVVRPHPSLPCHVGVVDTRGTYRVVKLGDDGAESAVAAVYELQLTAAGGVTQPVRKAWRAFEPLLDDGLVCATVGSGRILYAQLPLVEGEAGPVFLFGEHDGPVLCLASNGGLLLSGGADGCVRLWSLDSGAQLDWARPTAGAAHVTAVAFVGPLMVATGTEQGTVCMYDISTRRMEAVQRFHPDTGPVTALAARLTPAQTAQAVTAAAPRALDGGGVVAGPAGLPWRCPPGPTADGKDTQLAIGSSAGWLHVYTAAGVGETAWQHCRTAAVDGTPYLSYSPDGNYLAIGSGSYGGRLSVLDASDMQVVHERHFPPGGLSGAGAAGAAASGSLLGAGFLPMSAGGSALVAMQRGGNLAGGLRLRLYAAPAGELPCMVEVTLPLPPPNDLFGEREAELAEGQDFLDWLERKAAAPLPAGVPPPPGSRSPGGTAWTRPGGRTASPPRPHAAAASGSGPGSPFAPRPASPLAPVRGGPADRPSPPVSRSLAEPWASPWSAAAAGAAAAGSPARTWQAQRPNTQPAPRSWLTGLPPRPDFLPQAEPASAAPLSAPQTSGAVRSRYGAATAAAADRPPDAGGAAAWPERESEGELLQSSTLLPASGIASRAATAEGGRYGPSFDGGNGDAAELSSDEAPAWEYGAAAGQATWRDGDLSMGPELFRSFAPVQLGAGASTRGGTASDARTGSSGSGAGSSLSGSFRFQPVPRPQPHPDVRSASGAGASRPGCSTQHLAGGASATSVSQREPSPEAGRDSRPSLPPRNQQPQVGEGVLEDEAQRMVEDVGGWGPGGRDSTLERTAYFGDELAAALQSSAGGQDEEEASDTLMTRMGMHDAPGAGGGGREGDDEEPQPRQRNHLGQWQQGVPFREGRGSDGLKAQRAVQQAEADEGAEAVAEDEEELVPRGSAALPRPQRPVPRPLHPPSDHHHHQAHPQQGGDSEEGDLLPRARRSVATDPADPVRSLQLGEAPAAAATDGDAAQAVPGGEAGLVERAGDEDGVEGGRWAGWINSDLLGDGTAAGPAAAGAPAREKVRPAPAPRQPPALANARMQISGEPAGAPRVGASCTAAASSSRSLPPQPPEHRGREPEDSTQREEWESGPAPATALFQQRQQDHGGAGRYATADESHDGFSGFDVDATSAQSVSASGGPSPSNSLVHSPAVLLGSPATSTVTRGSVGPHRSAPAAGPSDRHQQRQPQPAAHPQQLHVAFEAEGRSAAGTGSRADSRAGAAGVARVGGGAGAARQHLQYLRQQRQHQQLRRLRPPAPSGKPCAAGAPVGAKPAAQGASGRDRDSTAPAEDPSCYQGPRDDASEADSAAYGSARLSMPPPEVSDSPWGLPGAAGTPAAELGGQDGEADWGYGPAGADTERLRGPPAAPAFGSSALLLRRMQALEQVLAQEPPSGPIVTRGSGQPGRGGAGGGAGGRGAGQAYGKAAAASAVADVGEAAVEEAARRAATAVSNVPAGVQLYHDLPAVDAKPQQPKVAKQLHPGWVASRQLKPEMGSLWRPEEQVAEISNTRGVTMYVPPTPADVASSLLRLRVL